MIFIGLFLVPTVIAFYFSLTRWTLFDTEFIGLDNYVAFFSEPALIAGLKNTLIYATVTSGVKVVLGMALAVLLTAPIVGRGFMRSIAFFPVLVSTIGIGLTFQVFMHPTDGVFNNVLAVVGIEGPGWLIDPQWALLSVALRRCLERSRPRDRHLHRRDPVHPERVLRSGQGRWRDRLSRAFATSPFPLPSRPRSRW